MKEKKQINFVELDRQHLPLKDEILSEIDNIIKKSSFILGNQVEEFEKEYASFCNTKFCLGTDSGTSALHLALRALDIKQGDEVITVPNTFIATVLAISFSGAKPVFIDIDKKTFNMNPSLIEEAITPKTKAIIPVHLYGQPANMGPILEIANKYNLKVIEDACQAHGAEYKGKKAGSLGHLGCFSFYPSKNLGCMGDGGAIITNDEDLHNKLLMLRDYGQKVKYHHLIKGFNNRLDALQAAVLRIKLKHLEAWNNQRRNNAIYYNKGLENTDIVTPIESEFVKHIYHLYVIQSKKRDELQQFLKEKGIMTGIHYPIPVHLQEAYYDLGYKKGDFPITEGYAEQILSLPMFPELKKEEITYITDIIKSFKRK